MCFNSAFAFLSAQSHSAMRKLDPTCTVGPTRLQVCRLSFTLKEYITVGDHLLSCPSTERPKVTPVTATKTLPGTAVSKGFSPCGKRMWTSEARTVTMDKHIRHIRLYDQDCPEQSRQPLKEQERSYASFLDAALAAVTGDSLGCISAQEVQIACRSALDGMMQQEYSSVNSPTEQDGLPGSYPIAGGWTVTFREATSL